MHLSIYSYLMILLFFACTETQKPSEITTQSEQVEEKKEKLVRTDINQILFDKGKMIFEGQCAACHNANHNTKIGPGLKGVMARRGKDWVHEFTKNSQKMIAEGDSMAVVIYEEYNEIVMQDFPLTDEQIEAIFYYVDNEVEFEPVDMD